MNAPVPDPGLSGPDPDGGVEMTDGEFAAIRGVEVTAAMEAEDVDAGLVEKFANALGLAYVAEQMPEYARNLRLGLAAVVPEIQAQALREAADRLHARTDGVNREGTKGWPERHREVYAHAIDEASDALREDADRLTAATGGPAT